MAKSKQNEQDLWDICDDFLDPLVDLLEDFNFDGDKVYSAVVKEGETAFRFESRVIQCLFEVDFAMLWLQVHNSVDLADRVAEKLKYLHAAVSTQALKKLRPNASGIRVAKTRIARTEVSPDGSVTEYFERVDEPSWADGIHEVRTYRQYFQYLSILLRDGPIRKRDIPRAMGPPMTKKCIAEIFDKHRNQITGEFLQEHSAKPDGNKWRFPSEALPVGWEGIYERHRQNNRTENNSC